MQEERPCTPYKGLCEEARPERGTIYGLQVYERVGILVVEVYERVSNSVIFIFCLQKGRSRLTDEFYGFKKSRKLSGFVNDLYVKDSASTAVEGCKIPN